MSLHVDSYGSGAPLLLIHGWGMHGGMWDGVAKQLAQHFRVHAVDLPGHGYSEWEVVSGKWGVGSGKWEVDSGEQGAAHLLPTPYSPLPTPQLLDYIVDELAAQFTGPLNVCGWSLGGQIALRWAQRYPQQVSRLVLVASTPSFVRRADWPCAMAAETLAEFAAALRQNYAQTLRRFLALQVRGGEQERELLATLRGALFSRGEPDLAALRAGLEILRDSDLRNALPEVTQATLVIAGERDTLTPLPAAQYLASRLSDARLALIKGAAHAPFLSHPEEFMEHLMRFLHE
jgi:pimeloyl-[acyl-carrier protein] methyl ester esterase